MLFWKGSKNPLAESSSYLKMFPLFYPSFFLFLAMLFPMSQETYQQPCGGAVLRTQLFAPTGSRTHKPSTGFPQNSDMGCAQSVTARRLVKPRCHGRQIQVLTVRLYTTLLGQSGRYENTRWHGKQPLSLESICTLIFTTTRIRCFKDGQSPHTNHDRTWSGSAPARAEGRRDERRSRQEPRLRSAVGRTRSNFPAARPSQPIPFGRSAGGGSRARWPERRLGRPALAPRRCRSPRRRLW